MEKNKAVRKGKNPEEQLDLQSISGGYRYFLWVIVFLVGGITPFVGLMSELGFIIMGVTVASIGIPVLLVPTIWDVDTNSRFIRRIKKQFFFPIRAKQFFISKIKIGCIYGGSFWVISLLLQLIASPLFGVKNIVWYQGILLAAGLANLFLYATISVVGARLRE